MILVDDYSTDGSTYGIEKRFKNLRVERPLKRAGLGNARATALRSVETPWLIWLDADDEFLPARIQTLLSEPDRFFETGR